MKDSEIRKRLKKAICCLSAVLILSVVSGAVLLNSIGSTNGWGRTEKQEYEIYTKEQIDKFITSVLIIVQNQPLSSDKAGADMVFIASFDSFRQRLTMAALYSQMEAGDWERVRRQMEEDLAEYYAKVEGAVLVKR